MRKRTCAYQGVKNVSFIVNFAYVLNKRFLAYRETNVSHAAETHLEPSQTCKIEPFVEMVSGFVPLTVFANSFILDV